MLTVIGQVMIKQLLIERSALLDIAQATDGN